MFSCPCGHFTPKQQTSCVIPYQVRIRLTVLHYFVQNQVFLCDPAYSPWNQSWYTQQIAAIKSRSLLPWWEQRALGDTSSLTQSNQKKNKHLKLQTLITPSPPPRPTLQSETLLDGWTNKSQHFKRLAFGGQISNHISLLLFYVWAGGRRLGVGWGGVTHEGGREGLVGFHWKHNWHGPGDTVRQIVLRLSVRTHRAPAMFH